jgi:hypothetical protein
VEDYWVDWLCSVAEHWWAGRYPERHDGFPTADCSVAPMVDDRHGESSASGLVHPVKDCPVDSLYSEEEH